MGLKVIIVGGGLAGGLLANGLVNNNIDVTVYERDATNSKREGYQIRLGDAAIKAFRMCLTEEVTDAILMKLGQSRSSTSEAPSIYTSKFRLILDLSRIPSYAKSSAINRVVLRDMFIEPIHAADRVKYGKRFTHYEIVQHADNTESVLVHFADGSTDTCDLLIAADGSASKINQQVGARNLVPITTHWSFLAKGSLPPKRLAKIPATLQKGPIIVFSKGASFFYALYMPAKEDGSANSDSNLEYDEDAASYFWGIHIPKADVPYKDVSEIPDRLEFCMSYMRNWAPEFHAMLSAGADEEGANDMYAAQLRASTKPAKDWRASLQHTTKEEGHPRVWLLGDAIHAMQPTRGMGGNQAMLDCADMLPEILKLNAQADSGKPPSLDEIRVSCNAYEARMLDRAFDWVQKSGGATMLTVNLDGPLGYLVYVAGCIFVPLAAAYLRIAAYFSSGSK